MPTHLSGRRVLVTGAGGFVASHVVERLVADGAEVGAFVHYDSRGGHGNADVLDAATLEHVRFHVGDLRDPFTIDRVVAGHEIVVHLGALSPIPYSYVAPAEYVDTNVRGTLNVLEAVRRHGVHRLVVASTSETYGSAIRTPIDEDHPLRPRSPYAASKVGADKLAEAYHLSFEVPVVIVRPFNGFGPRQSARAFLPSVLAQAFTSDVIRVGALDPVRDMNFVGDLARGFALACSVSGIDGRTFNLATGRGTSMRELLDLAIDAVGRGSRVETDLERVRPATSEVRKVLGDATAARDALGWRPEVSLEEGVGRTAAWVEQNLGLFAPQRYAI